MFYVFMAFFIVCCILFAVIFSFKTKPDVNTNLQIITNKKDHPWLTLRNDSNLLNRNLHLGSDYIFSIKSGKIEEASHLLKDEPFYELTTCEFFYLTGHIDSDKNGSQKNYLVRCVKDKYTKNGKIQVSFDSSHILIIRYGFSWGWLPNLELVDYPIVVRLTHKPNQVFVNLFPL